MAGQSYSIATTDIAKYDSSSLKLRNEPTVK